MLSFNTGKSPKFSNVLKLAASYLGKWRIFLSQFGHKFKEDKELPLNRSEKLLNRIDIISQTGLEIGPLSTPTVTKSESSGRVKYVDYAPAEKLREVYSKDPYVQVENIVEVDLIWGDQTLPELVDGERFGYVIASHVIEHVPDMIGWLNEVADVLDDHGTLSLAIPDKRYTFDFQRELSTPGMIIDAYLRKLRRPSPQAVFDYLALAVSVDPKQLWSGMLDRKALMPSLTLQQAFTIARDTYNSETYQDAHVNVFTPASFLNLLEIFSHLGLLDYTVADFYDTAHFEIEFFVTLERLPRQQQREERLAAQLASLEWAKSRLSPKSQP